MATQGPIKYELKGAADLLAALKELPQVAEKKVMNTGLSKGAARMRLYMRRRAPKGDTGELKKSIMVKRIRARFKGATNKYIVGLLTRQYYKVLDVGRKGFRKKSGVTYAGTEKFNSVGTGIEESWNLHKEEVAQLIIDEAMKELAREAGKLYVKSLRR